MKLFKQKISVSETHQYVLDLERVTLLRQKEIDKIGKIPDAPMLGRPSWIIEEIARYDNIIECMQLVLQRLNEQ